MICLLIKMKKILKKMKDVWECFMYHGLPVYSMSRDLYDFCQICFCLDLLCSQLISKHFPYTDRGCVVQTWKDSKHRKQYPFFSWLFSHFNTKEQKDAGYFYTEQKFRHILIANNM